MKRLGMFHISEYVMHTGKAAPVLSLCETKDVHYDRNKQRYEVTAESDLFDEVESDSVIPFYEFTISPDRISVARI